MGQLGARADHAAASLHDDLVRPKPAEVNDHLLELDPAGPGNTTRVAER